MNISNQPHILKKYEINMGFSYFQEIGILSGMNIYNNTIIHFIETRLQNTIGTIINIQIALLTGRQVI